MKAIFTLSAGVGHLLALPNLPHDVPVIRLEDAGMTGQMVRYGLISMLVQLVASLWGGQP